MRSVLSGDGPKAVLPKGHGISLIFQLPRGPRYQDYRSPMGHERFIYIDRKYYPADGVNRQSRKMAPKYLRGVISRKADGISLF